MSKKITLKIADMTCPNCAMTLEGIEDRLAGVEMAEASYHKGQMVVRYDPSRLSQAEIEAEIQRLGFKVTGTFSQG